MGEVPAPVAAPQAIDEVSAPGAANQPMPPARPSSTASGPDVAQIAGGVVLLAGGLAAFASGAYLTATVEDKPYLAECGSFTGGPCGRREEDGQSERMAAGGLLMMFGGIAVVSGLALTVFGAHGDAALVVSPRVGPLTAAVRGSF
jgi:hypothetical protein